MRWVLLDEVIRIEKGVKATCRSKMPKSVYSSEVLLLEMMAQTGGLLIGAESDFNQNLIFGKVENAEYSNLPPVGTPILVEASVEMMRAEGAWADAQVSADGEVIAKARVLLASAGDLISGTSGSITFHEAFMDHFEIRSKVVTPVS